MSRIKFKIKGRTCFTLFILLGMIISAFFAMYLLTPEVAATFSSKSALAPALMVLAGAALLLLSLFQNTYKTPDEPSVASRILHMIANAKIGYCIAITYLLCSFSIGTIAPFHPGTALDQFVFMIIGIVAWFVMRLFIVPNAKVLYPIIVGGVMLLLVVALILPATGGAHNWIKVGGFSLQVTELVKIAFLVLVCSISWEEYLTVTSLRKLMGANKHDKTRIAIVVAAIVIMLGQLFLAREYGTLVIIGLMALLMVFFVKQKPYVLILLIGVVLVGWIIISSAGHVMTRLNTWQISFDEPGLTDLYRNDGYQRMLSLCAYAVAGLDGIGYANPNSIMRIVPAHSNDLMLGTVIETFGFLAGMLIVAVIVIMAILGAKTSEGFRTYGSKLTALLAALYLILHTLIPACSATDVLPIVGLGIPFVSMGGTALMTNFMVISFFSPPLEDKDVIKLPNFGGKKHV